jgi:adenylate kinase
MRIVLVGPAQAGTGTQGRLLAELLGVPYLPAEIGADFEGALLGHTAGFVLDGFPRTVAEASALDRFLRARAADLDVALHFQLPDAQLTPAEDALLEHYRGRVVELDADGAAEVVHERVLDGLREALVAA